MVHEVKSLLSLCQKAGMLVSGEYSCEKALQSGEAQLVIVADDASANTRKKFVNKAFYYNVPALVYGCKEGLSQAIGKENRAVLVVIDRGFGLKIKGKIDLAT